MNTRSLPSLCLSHGSPMMALEDSPAARIIDRLGTSLRRPRAVVVASAHFMPTDPTVTSGLTRETIHDAGGFPRPLYEIQCPTQGARLLAAAIASQLTNGGFDARVDELAGIDHGTWVPLRRMFPDADIPVVALSLNPSQTSTWN